MFFIFTIALSSPHAGESVCPPDCACKEGKREQKRCLGCTRDRGSLWRASALDWLVPFCDFPPHRRLLEAGAVARRRDLPTTLFWLCDSLWPIFFRTTRQRSFKPAYPRSSTSGFAPLQAYNAFGFQLLFFKFQKRWKSSPVSSSDGSDKQSGYHENLISWKPRKDHLALPIC